MSERSPDREAIEAEIDRIRSLGLDDLRTLWRTTFRSSAPMGFTKDLVVRFICWHVQEQAFGGLDPATAKILDGLARGSKVPDRRLKAGTVLVREYQGIGTPSRWCRAAMSGVRAVTRVSRPLRGRSPARPGTGHASSGCAPVAMNPNSGRRSSRSAA